MYRPAHIYAIKIHKQEAENKAHKSDPYSYPVIQTECMCMSDRPVQAGANVLVGPVGCRRQGGLGRAEVLKA